jgi:hypothetical protein
LQDQTLIFSCSRLELSKPKHIPANPRMISSLNAALGTPPLHRLCAYTSVMPSQGAIALRFGWVNRDTKLI